MILLVSTLALLGVGAYHGLAWWRNRSPLALSCEEYLARSPGAAPQWVALEDCDVHYWLAVRAELTMSLEDNGYFVPVYPRGGDPTSRAPIVMRVRSPMRVARIESAADSGLSTLPAAIPDKRRYMGRVLRADPGGLRSVGPVIGLTQPKVLTDRTRREITKHLAVKEDFILIDERQTPRGDLAATCLAGGVVLGGAGLLLRRAGRAKAADATQAETSAATRAGEAAGGQGPAAAQLDAEPDAGPLPALPVPPAYDGPPLPPGEVLRQCRDLAGATPRPERLVETLAAHPPHWLKPETTDERLKALRGWYDHQRELLVHGRVVWGHVVHAAVTMFKPGAIDGPAEVVYGADEAFDDDPSPLAAVAEQLWASREDVDPAGEVPFHARDEVSTGAAGGREIFRATIMLPRRHLPRGCLADRLLPLLVCPEKTEAAMALPAVWWSPALAAAWGDVPPG
jgi:hypothetical protein